MSKSKYRITRHTFGRGKTPEGALRFFQKFMDGFVLNHYIKNVIFHSFNQSILNSYLYPILLFGTRVWHAHIFSFGTRVKSVLNLQSGGAKQLLNLTHCDIITYCKVGRSDGGAFCRSQQPEIVNNFVNGVRCAHYRFGGKQ